MFSQLKKKIQFMVAFAHSRKMTSKVLKALKGVTFLGKAGGIT